MSSSDYQELFKKPKPPKFLETIRETSKWSYIAVTSSLLALIIAILSWVIPSPTLKSFFQWSLILIVIAVTVGFVISTTIYFIRILQYISRLEQKFLQIRRIFLTNSGIDDVEPGSDLKFSISGIADEQGTINLIISLTEKTGLRIGSLLDVVVTATQEVWGYVKVSRIVDGQAWAFPVDRRNPKFWERLEDQMKIDPSPPLGIHLEPLLPPEIRKFLHLNDKESEEI